MKTSIIKCATCCLLTVDEVEKWIGKVPGLLAHKAEKIEELLPPPLFTSIATIISWK